MRVLIVRATKKLLRLVGPPTAAEDDQGTTLLGPWYANVLFWRPRVVLVVNESTLLPVFLPLAPAATLTSRIPKTVAAVLRAHGASSAIVAEEVRRMGTCALGTTTSRSTVGMLTEFAHLAEFHQDDDPAVDLTDLAIQLATTPCSPLYNRNVSPDRELTATLQTINL